TRRCRRRAARDAGRRHRGSRPDPARAPWRRWRHRQRLLGRKDPPANQREPSHRATHRRGVAGAAAVEERSCGGRERALHRPGEGSGARPAQGLLRDPLESQAAPGELDRGLDAWRLARRGRKTQVGLRGGSPAPRCGHPATRHPRVSAGQGHLSQLSQRLVDLGTVREGMRDREPGARPRESSVAARLRRVSGRRDQGGAMGVVRWSCAAWSCALLLSVPAQAAPHDRGDLEKTQAYLIEQLGKYRDPRAVEASLSFDRCSLRYSYRREFPRLEVRLPGVDLKTIDPRSVKVDESSIEFATFGERNSIEYREALNGT